MIKRQTEHKHDYVQVRDLLSETYDVIICIDCGYRQPTPRNDE